MAAFEVTAEDGQQEEMAVVIFKLKGGAGTLQKGFDTISQAISAFGPQARVIAARVPPRELVAANGTGKAATATDDEDIGIVDEAVEQQEDAAAPSKGRAGGRQYERRFTFLTDFDLGGNGTPFKEFIAKRQPANEYDKYLLTALWLHRHGGCETFKADNVFTCFRAADWKQLGDFTQPMRMMKASKSYFDNPERGQWKLTQLGLDAANAVPAA